MAKTLAETLRDYSIQIDPDFTQAKQRNGSQWLFPTETKVGEQTLQSATFGDFKTGFEGSWEGWEGDLPDEERKALTKQRKKAAAEKRAMQETHWEEARVEAIRFLRESCTDRGQPTPYLVRKKIDKLFGALVHVNEHGSAVLIVPLRDIDGKVWNYQRIYPAKLDAGDKFLLKGAKKQGLFHLFSHTGQFNPEGVVYVAEGFATAASIYLAFAETQNVVAAIDCGNILRVAAEIHSAFPGIRFVFCADNDRKPDNGDNRGVTEAQLAAHELAGEVRIARFLERDSGFSDFNDVHALYGLEQVKEQIEYPERFKPEGEYQIVACKGVPPEQRVAESILKELKDKVLVEDQDLFTWAGTHWNHCDYRGLNAFRNAILQVSEGKYGAQKVDACLKTLMRLAPNPPKGVSMFNPQPLIACFENGSLHLHRNSDQSYRLEFRESSRGDYQTTCLPFRFPVDPTSDGQLDLPRLKQHLLVTRNAEFDAMLERIWKGDVDQAEKIRLYRQNLGALLISAFPQVFIYVGPPKTGKSTLLLVAARLTEERNRCAVDPTEFEGFHMETMLNKRLNVHTDIKTHRSLADSSIKQIIDRFPVRIRRKGLRDVYGVLPPVHMFAANKMPKSLEASTNALDRRLIIVKTERFQPVGLYDKDYHEHVFDQGEAGVVAFAVGGLLDLIERKGHYSVPESGRQAMEKWKEDSDPVSLFLNALKRGEIRDKQNQVLTASEGEIVRGDLWDLYDSWHDREFRKTTPFGRNTFFDRVETAGYASHRYKDRRVFKGIAARPAQDAIC